MINPNQDPHVEWVKLVTQPSEILIVEDDESFSELILIALKDFHCCPTIAPDGETAQQLLASEKRYDLVVVDYKLPRMSGYMLIKHIFSLAREVPVIVLSGYVTPNMIMEISELGIVPFVYKPTANSVRSFGRLFRTLGIKPISASSSDCSCLR